MVDGDDVRRTDEERPSPARPAKLYRRTGLFRPDPLNTIAFDGLGFLSGAIHIFREINGMNYWGTRSIKPRKWRRSGSASTCVIRSPFCERENSHPEGRFP
jgi:hypothetical protein